MHPFRTTLPLLAAVLFAACSTQVDLAGFTEACTAAPSDAALELEFEGERLVAARVPVHPDALPSGVQEAADRHRPGERTSMAFREWREDGRAWRLQRHHDGEAAGPARELLLAEDGSVLEEVHFVDEDRVPPGPLAAASARGRLRVQRAAIVRSELRPHHWRFACEDGASRPYRIESDLTGDIVRIARIAHAHTTAW